MKKYDMRCLKCGNETSAPVTLLEGDTDAYQVIRDHYTCLFIDCEGRQEPIDGVGEQ